MAGYLGIDHPLIAVRDIAAMRARYAALGFRMTPVSAHPWGTSTSIAVFPSCLIELIGIGDRAALDRMETGGFRFGRVVERALAEREGVCLVALNSEDAAADAATAAARGVACQGAVEFGRDIVLPDSRPDRTATSLRILYDPALPRLSHFICQQHRRDLIEVPAWLDHPNGARGIGALAILARAEDQPRVRARLAGLYGEAAVGPAPGGFAVQTGRGRFLVMEAARAREFYGPLPEALSADTAPFCLAIHVTVRSLDRVRPFLAGVGGTERAGRLVLPAAGNGHVVLAFEEG